MFVWSGNAKLPRFCTASNEYGSGIHSCPRYFGMRGNVLEFGCNNLRTMDLTRGRLLGGYSVTGGALTRGR